MNSAGHRRGGPSRAFEVALEAARSDETTAAQELASLMDAEAAGRQQLEQLKQFLSEYMAQEQAAVLGSAGGLLGNRQLFIERLVAALGLQHRRCASHAQAVSAQRARWVGFQGRRRALERLIEQKKSAAVLKAARREQAVLDAIAGQQTRVGGFDDR